MAAQYGQAVFKTTLGQTLNIDLYCDDTAGNPIRFDGGSGASSTSPTFYTLPVSGILVDFVLAAATGQTKTQINRNNQSTGRILRNSVYLASVAFRPPLSVPYKAGDQLTMNQLA